MIVTLCGSARFEDHFKTWNEALTMAGHTVFTLTRYASEKGRKNWYSDAEKQALDEAHKRKINASEAVLVLNVFGYMGLSTLAEVEHAKARKKKLYALESWGKGNGIGGNHFDYVRAACRRIVPEYQGSPIDTTSNSGFRYAYDLLDDVVTGERQRNLVVMVGECDDRVHGRAAKDGVLVVDACCGRTMPYGFRCTGCPHAKAGDTLVPRVHEDPNPPNE